MAAVKAVYPRKLPAFTAGPLSAIGVHAGSATAITDLTCRGSSLEVYLMANGVL